MTEIIVIDPIDTTHEGPSAPGPSGERQMIHLMQGSLDGACGPYSLVMALLICGVVDRNQAVSYGPVDRRKPLGRLLGEWHQLGPLVKCGTGPGQLAALLARTYGRHIEAEFSAESGADLRPFIEAQICINHPVLLAISYHRGGHWVVVIGLEYEITDEGRSLCRFLVLDPAAKTPPVCAWNGVIDARGGGGRYPFTWWTGGKTVQFSFALAIWPRKKNGREQAVFQPDSFSRTLD
ncbi:MAG: hypothetical protein A2Y69_15940 [Candidatus Aminicenantes bacterium RBG_13_59_9]|nr:MAG: hypothetical protein A2Y69_15940 [Candidatus Aminicenantes bacterium RBG_13_59_9]